jgi:hypothetical protein
MKRKDEEFCKLRFTEYITNIYPVDAVRWEDVPIEEEPPDYYLYLDGTKYAVEVTDMIEQVNVGTTRSIPRNVVIDILAAFVKEVEKEAKKCNWLSGAYTVSFRKPVQNFRAVEIELREQILLYLQSTKELELAPHQELIVGNNQVFSIYKVHSKKDIIYPGLPVFTKWESQSNQESLILLEERLTDKLNKLRNLSSQIILLILDTNWYFPNNKAFVEAIPLLPEIPRFHTVFVVSPNFSDFLLYSENPEWQ